MVVGFDLMFGFFRKRREIDKQTIECLVSIVNDLLWQLDTLPNSKEFQEKWNYLQEIEKNG